MSHLDDDGTRSSDFTVNDGEQRLWIGVRPVWYNEIQGDVPVIQVCYQHDRESALLQGPVFIDEATWDDLVRAVKWRRRSYLPLWKRVLKVGR